MARFANDAARVYVTEGDISEVKPAEGTEYIALKGALSIGEQSQLQAAIMRVRTVAGKSGAIGNVDLDLRMADYMGLLYELYVVDWYLLGADGKPVAYAKGKVNTLSSDDPLVDRALAEAARRNPTQRAMRLVTQSGSTTSQ